MGFNKHVIHFQHDMEYESKQEGIEAFRKLIATIEYAFKQTFPGVQLYSPNEELEAIKDGVFQFEEFLWEISVKDKWHRFHYGFKDKGYQTKWHFYKFMQQFHFTIPSIAWEAFINYNKSNGL